MISQLPSLRFIVPFLNALLLCFSSPAQTFWGGIITTNETLTAAQSPYIIDQNTLVMEGVTLTVEPGTVLRFRDSVRMQINGTIRAIGTESDSIVFTRAAGSSSGWGGLHFHDLSEDYNELTDQGSRLSYVQIKHTISVTVSNSPTYVLMVKNASPMIEHCEISCYEGPIFFFVSGATMRDCSIHDSKTANTLNAQDHTFQHQLTIERCRFSGIYGGIDPSASRVLSLFGNILLKDCVVENTNHEITAAIYSNAVRLHNNIFRNSEIAVALLGGWQPSTEIIGNRFSGNKVNLLLSACQRMPVISENDFMDFETNSVEVSQYHYPFLTEDCATIDTYFTMNLQNNFWGVSDSGAIAASIYDFYDNFLEQVIVDFSGFTPTPFNAASESAASLPQNIHCTSEIGLKEHAVPLVKISPNPVSDGYFYLEPGTSGLILLTLTDLTGRIVEKKQVNYLPTDQPILFRTEKALHGPFLLTIGDRNGSSGTYRIVFQ